MHGKSAFTVKQWAEMVPVDSEEGIRLLAATLLRRSERCYEWAAKRAENARRVAAGEDVPGYVAEFDGPPERYQKDADERYRRLKAVSRIVRQFGAEDCADRARTVHARDFRWRWFHFRDFLMLAAYVKPGLPDWAAERDKPIADMWDNALTSWLESLLPDMACGYYHEKHGFEFRGPRGRDPSEWGIYHLSSDLHLEPTGRGQPQGRRWPDGFGHAVGYAYSFLSEAERNGNSISKDEALRQALGEFHVVTERNFLNHPDRESCIVITAGSTHAEKLASAVKIIREALPPLGESV